MGGLIIALIITALLFLYFAVPRPLLIPLHARIICAEGTLNPDRTIMNRGWRVAVTKPDEQSRFWHWSVWIQDTNREPNRIYPLIPLKKDTLDYETLPETTNEHGILMGNGYGLMPTGKVYRIVGAHNEPGSHRRLPQWVQYLPPRIQKIIATPKQRFATSEWYEISLPLPATNVTSIFNQ